MSTLDHAWNSLMTLTLQSGAVCLLAGVGILLLRKAAAASRHLLLVLSVSALLAVPLLALFLPHWQLPLAIPAWNRSAYVAERAAFEARESARMPGVDARLPHAEPSASGSSAMGGTLFVRSQEGVTTHTPSPSASTASAPVIGIREARVPPWQTAGFRFAVLAIWLLGLGIGLLRLMAGLIGTWRVTSRETISTPLLTEGVTRLQAELGMEHAVTVRQTLADSTLPVPLTWGLFRPTLLLPPAFLEWPRERQRMVVLHELAHIQRADWLVQVLVQITCALYWFHPLVWWTTHRLQAESERACDDTVLLTGVAPSAYAETLLEVLRTMNRPKKSLFSPASMLNMARPPIEARLRAILSPQLRQRPTRSITFIAIGGTLACAIGLASIQVKAGQTTSAERAEVARAQADAQAARASASRAAAEERARQAAVKAQKRARSEGTAALRRKLSALEELLVRNQKENTELRQQLKALMAQQKSVAAANRDAAEINRRLALEADRTRALDERIATESEKQALEKMVEDLKQQLALTQTQAKQTEELYRNGLTAAQEVAKVKGEQETTRLRLEAALEQLRAAQAGRKTSAKGQAAAQRRLELAEAMALLKQAEVNLELVRKRYEAGQTSNQEVQQAEAEISRMKVEIDKLQLKSAQEPKQ